LYRFDNDDNYKFLYSAKYAVLTKQIANWNIYYTKGLILQNQNIEYTSYGLMLQNTTLEAWREQDSIPTLIRLVEISSDTITEDYNIFTFEPKILTFPQYDTVVAKYVATSERAINIDNYNNRIQITPYSIISPDKRYTLNFNEYNFEVTLNNGSEKWPIYVKNKLFVDNQWQYISTKLYTNDTLQIKLIFPEGYTWQDAQDGILPSIDLWYNKLEIFVNQINLMRIE